MLKVGLTGGIGSGKSTVAAMLAELGAVVVDSDEVAREVVAPGTPGLTALAESFGSGVLNDDGSLNRQSLADVAFADDGARERLNSILHPLIGRRTMELIGQAPVDSIVVQDIPLLVEKSMGALFDLVVVVVTDDETRVERLVGRGLSESDARARLKAQATDEQRRAAADVLLSNDGEPADLAPIVGHMWRERLTPFERNLRQGTGVTDGLDEAKLTAAEVTRVTARLWVAGAGSLIAVDYVRDADFTVKAKDGSLAQAAAALAASGFPEISPNVCASADPGRPVRLKLS